MIYLLGTPIKKKSKKLSYQIYSYIQPTTVIRVKLECRP